MSEKSKLVEIYTDGACSYNPGPGGWGVVLLYKGHEKRMSGFCENTTNNRMEILAVIKGLQELKEPCDVLLYSDSAYVVNAFNQHWIEDWASKGWKTADKKPVKNVELWQELFMLTKKHNVTFIKVKGHADNEYNNICDKLAREEIEKAEQTKTDAE